MELRSRLLQRRRDNTPGEKHGNLVWRPTHRAAATFFQHLVGGMLSSGPNTQTVMRQSLMTGTTRSHGRSVTCRTAMRAQ